MRARRDVGYANGIGHPLLLALLVIAIAPRIAAASCDPCVGRRGGALVDFAIGAETLRVWSTNTAFIDEAKRLLATGGARIPVFDDLRDGRDCDPQWTWHPDPAAMAFADAAIELCDGLPSHVEGDKPYWLGTVDAYCPWSARVTRVDDRRGP